MEKQISVAYELETLENQIGRTIVGATQDEANELKKEIKKLVQKVEETLIYQAGLPRGNANRIAENLQENLNYRLGHNLTNTREDEYNETKSNLVNIEKTELQDVSTELERFQYEGIASKDNKYCGTVEEICDEVIAEYRKKLGGMGSRGADEAYLDIKNGITRTSNNIQDIHEYYTRRIKQDITNRVGELGLKINEVLSQHIEQTVDKKAEYSDFTKTMKIQTKSQDEVTIGDVKEIAENEKEFKDTPTRYDNNRKKLEDMFK